MLQMHTKCCLPVIVWVICVGSYVFCQSGMVLHFFPHAPGCNTSKINLFTDGMYIDNVGIGVYFNGAGFMSDLTSIRYHRSDIMWRELYAFVCILRTWGPSLQGKNIICGCDNQAILATVASGTTKH